MSDACLKVLETAVGAHGLVQFEEFQNITKCTRRSSKANVVDALSLLGPFAPTGHKEQNPPFWMTKECSRFEYKGIPTFQA